MPPSTRATALYSCMIRWRSPMSAVLYRIRKFRQYEEIDGCRSQRNAYCTLHLCARQTRCGAKLVNFDLYGYDPRDVGWSWRLPGEHSAVRHRADGGCATESVVSLRDADRQCSWLLF